MAFAAATHSRDLTDEHWDLIDRFLPERCAAQTVEGGRGRRPVPCSMASCGSRGLENRGLPCPTAIRRIKPAAAVSAVGPRRRAAEHPRNPRSGTPRPRLSGSAGSVHRWELRASQAKWRLLRQDETWQGVEDHGHRRSSGAPRRRPPGERHATRIHTSAGHTRTAVCQSAAGASHRRRRLRVGQAGRGTGAPWRGTDRATPEDPETADARRSPAASLPTAAESRTTLCLVQNFRRIVVRYERWPRTFSGCYTWPAASFCCGVMRWLLFQSIENAGWDQGRRRQWALPTPRAHLAGWRLHHRQHGLANTATGS
jgi:hypothetical protein